VAKDGTLLAYITIDGYNTTRGDNPTLADRPTIATASRYIMFDNFWHLKNLIVTTTVTSGIALDLGAKIENVKCTQSSGTANRDCFTPTFTGQIINCEGISTNGICVDTGTSMLIAGCYFHDSTTGIDLGPNDDVTIYGCLIDTCTTGINNTTNSDDIRILGNTIYGCTTGINAGTSNDAWSILNNILDANTDGIIWGQADRSVFMDYNCWDNTTDVTNVVKGDHAVTADPLLVDPANGDFTLKPGSPCLDTGMQVGVNQGAVGDYKVNIGADQRDVVAARHGNMSGGLQC
jgi:hypothetical protein